MNNLTAISDAIVIVNKARVSAAHSQPGVWEKLCNVTKYLESLHAEEFKSYFAE